MRITTRPDLWTRLQSATQPIVLYGMGDGADKILGELRSRSIPVQGVFASPGFVRGQVYQGFQVKHLEDLERELGGGLLVLLCFASHRPEVLELVHQVARRHALFAPDVPVCGGETFTRSFYEQHKGELEEVYGLLADDQSRRVLESVINYKLTGEIRYLLECESPRDEVFGLLGLGDNEVYVDAGAYTGDTVEEFCGATGGRYRRIIALEPDRRNFRKLQAAVERQELSSIECHNLGCWSGQAVLSFSHSSGRQSALQQKGAPDTPVDAIDNLLKGEPATLIKYDVEGAEAEALRGTAETIRSHRPKLMISAYHRSEDLFRLPLLVRDLCPGYRFYLRHHPCLPAWEIHYYVNY